MTLRVCTEVASAQPIAGTYLFKRGLGPRSPGHCCPFSPQRTSLAAPLSTISVAGRDLTAGGTVEGAQGASGARGLGTHRGSDGAAGIS